MPSLPGEAGSSIILSIRATVGRGHLRQFVSLIESGGSCSCSTHPPLGDLESHPASSPGHLWSSQFLGMGEGLPVVPEAARHPAGSLESSKPRPLLLKLNVENGSTLTEHATTKGPLGLGARVTVGILWFSRLTIMYSTRIIRKLYRRRTPTPEQEHWLLKHHFLC